MGSLRPLSGGLLALFIAYSAQAQLLRTHVAQGDLAGHQEGSVSAYLGIPFAAPPVGNDRWKPPLPPQPWTGLRPAEHFAASCQQAVTPKGFGPWTAEYVVQGAVSEDCLYLNVWTPAHGAWEHLPVLFWIYGGGFTSGSGSVAIYDGAALAAKGIIVVSVNYRVGVYGFLAHPELSAESPVNASGNYGLMDQVAGLKWVQQNIAAFGGDPARVTIAGQSAGAASVHHLIASPLADGLFSQAIAESGSGMGLAMPDRSAAEAVGTALSNAGGTHLSLAQLRALSPAELNRRLMAAAPGRGLQFGPDIDGLFLTPDSAGRDANDTPILTGMTAEEMAGLSPAYGKTTVASFKAQVSQAYGGSGPQLDALYAPKSDAAAWDATKALGRDRGLASLYFWAVGRLKSTRYPIYGYLWTHAEPGPESARYGAFHSSEIPYVFGTLDAAQRPFTALDRRLAVEMSGYWVNFVKTGNPNGTGLVAWPALKRPGMRILEIGRRTTARPVLPPATLKVFEHYVAGGGKLGLF